jgi:polysaccharide biosynthesis protein PslH
MGGQKGIGLFNRYLSKIVPFVCVGTQNNQPTIEDNYEFIPLFGTSKLRYINIFYFFTLRKIIKQHQITHIILEHPYYGWLGALLKSFMGVKLIAHSHNIESIRFKSMGKWWWKIMHIYENWVFHISDNCFFISNEDKEFGISNYKLNPTKCITVTYGIELEKAPSKEEKAAARHELEKLYGIKQDATILLFNGTLSYEPNYKALDFIINEINEKLLGSQLNYKIIICGKGLPLKYDFLKNYTTKNIIYAGFVNDINVYFKGSSIFLNPVNEGGGIKTKLVEALGMGMQVISTENGAIGVPLNICNGNLIIANTTGEYYEAILHFTKKKKEIGEEFFDWFYWGEIIVKGIKFLKKI